MGIEFKFNKPAEEVSTRSVPEQLAASLGSGLRIPRLIVNNEWQILNGTQKVKQDIFVTLATPVRIRLGQPDFGSMIPYYLFEHYTSRIQSEIINAAWDSLTSWVPQINLKDVQIDEQSVAKNWVDLIVIYDIKDTLRNDSVSIVLASPDATQLPPGRFVINGRLFFPVN